jgi:uncharacterized protein (TIGR02117 family)
VNTSSENCIQNMSIFASSNGVHVDIIIPIEQLDIQLKEELSLDSTTKYVAFGWGDRKFYLETPTWGDLKISTTLRSLFTNTSSVVHLTGYRKLSGSWKTQSICPEQMALLNAYLRESFSYRDDKHIIPIKGAHYGNNDAFYHSSNSYSVLFTCNSWVNKGLKKARVKTAFWTPFDWGIMRYFNTQS